MVFFNCNACGEALKKNQVEKHYQQKCRKCEVLSCVDCQKEFWGDAYKEHIKCISEEEKYSGKNWKPKVNANKGEQKQEAWTEQVVTAIVSCPSAKPQLKQLLQRIQDCPNIPRKQAKFENFVKNSMRVRESYLITEAWNIISAAANKNSAQSAANSEKNGTSHASNDETSENSQPSELNGDHYVKKLSKRERKEERQKKQHKPDKKKRKADDVEECVEQEERKSKKHKQGKKRRREEEDEVEDQAEEMAAEEELKKKQKKKKKGTSDEDVETEKLEPSDARQPVEARGPFSWEAAILEVLQKASDHEISLKKMKKKILAEFHSCGGDGKTYTDEKLLSRLTKYILRNPRLKVHKERVQLLP